MQRMMATTWLWSWVESPRIVGSEMEMMVPHAAQKRREIQLQLSFVPWQEIYESRCGGWCQQRAINFDKEFSIVIIRNVGIFQNVGFLKKGGTFKKGEFSKRGEVSFHVDLSSSICARAVCKEPLASIDWWWCRSISIRYDNSIVVVLVVVVVLQRISLGNEDGQSRLIVDA